MYDQDYIKIVKENILAVKKQYAALVYNADNIKEINNKDLHFTINTQLFLNYWWQLEEKLFPTLAIKKERETRMQCIT